MTEDSALAAIVLGSARLGGVRRQAGGGPADGPGLRGARNGRRFSLNRQPSGRCPFITVPIVGASKPHHLEDAAAVSLKLDARTIARLEEPYHPKAVVGHQ